MKKILLCTMFLVFLTIAPAVYAHPPSDIKITFDPQTKILYAVIMHDVSNPSNHYIKKVDIGLNGKEIISHEISKQDTNESQTVSYRIPDVKSGDVLSVEGYCSISGSLEKKIAVKTEK